MQVAKARVNELAKDLEKTNNEVKDILNNEEVKSTPSAGADGTPAQRSAEEPSGSE